MRLHTDREILRCIYDTYVEQYPDAGDPHVSIDVRAIAQKLGCRPELLFGRLYHDLRHRYRFIDEVHKLQTSLFEMTVGDKSHAVHFPVLVAVLAEKESEHRRARWSLGISVIALIVAIASAAIKLV
jgi:hypothetical protein